MLPYRPPAPTPQPTPAPTPQTANLPSNVSLAQAAGGGLIVTWAAPVIDGSHDAATGFDLQFRPSGTGAWTMVSGVTSPYLLSGLAAGAAFDVQVHSCNAAGTSAWSATSTLSTMTAVPNTPGGVTVARGNGNTLTVAWTTPGVDSRHNAATLFNVQSSPSGANSWTIVPSVTSPYTLSGLAAGAAIDVQVQASNAAGTSAWSATNTITTATAVPNAPSGLSLAQGTGSNLIVAWTAPAVDSTHNAATGYTLQSSPSGANTWTTVPSVTSPYTLSGLAAGVAIDVQVQATNASGTSTWAAATGITAATNAPNIPGGLSLAQGSGSNLTVSWVPPAIDSTHNPATGFNLRSSPSGANTWTTVPSVTSPYTLSGMAAGAAIDVQVQATNASGVSAWSATSTLTTATAVANTPSGLTLAQGTGSNLTVSWTAPAIDSTHNAATGFNLRSSPSGANTWTTVPGVTSPYTLSGMAAGTAIDVQVQSSNAGGTSAWSATSTLTTATAVANIPSGLTLAQGTGSNLTVSWTAPAIDSTHGAATGFNLRSSPSGAATWTTVPSVTSPYTLSGMASGAAIDVQVQSSNGAGISAWSATSTLTTATATPTAPNVPTIASVAPPSDGTTSKLTVTWTAPAVDSTHNAATGYNLRTSPSGAGTWTTVTGVTSPYTLTGLAAATAIDVEVQATNAAASPGAWSAITTGKTYASTVAVANPPTSTPIAHNTSTVPSPVTQANISGSPTTIQAQWSTSATTVPTTWQASSGAYSTYQAVWYLTLTTATNTAGSAYIWVQALNSSSQVIGQTVAGPYTIT